MISLEKLLDNSVAARNFTKLARLVADTGGKSISIRWGTVSLPFSASALSSAVVVSHGLGRTPVFIAYENFDTNVDNISTVAQSSTSLTVQARYVSAVTGTAQARWFAIG